MISRSENKISFFVKIKGSNAFYYIKINFFNKFLPVIKVF